MTFKVKDHYFKKAKKENFAARSVYKLEEIDKKYDVLKKGMIVLDLGYCPGSWTQYSSLKLGKSGKVIGIDTKPVSRKIENLQNVKAYEKDVFEVNIPQDVGVEEKFDVILSDMAPNTTGIKDVDQARSLDLVEKIFDIISKLLKQDGNTIIKVFDSQFAQEFLKSQKKRFKEFHYLKPKSTRSISKEFFVIGKGFIE